jgi:hypothetical protein
MTPLLYVDIFIELSNLIPMKCRSQEWVELYLHSFICLRGVHRNLAFRLYLSNLRVSLTEGLELLP